MSKGINRYEGKDKRRQRIKNHIAKDLRRGAKYHQRIIPAKNWEPPSIEYDEDDE